MVKNSVMAVAWFLVERQCPPNLDDMMATWEGLSWEYLGDYVDGCDAAHGGAAGDARAGPCGGRGALAAASTSRTRSLYLRQVRRLLDPNPQPWRGTPFIDVKIRRKRRLEY